MEWTRTQINWTTLCKERYVVKEGEVAKERRGNIKDWIGINTAEMANLAKRLKQIAKSGWMFPLVCQVVW